MKTFEFKSFSMDIYERDLKNKFNSLSNKEILNIIVENLKDLGVNLFYDECIVDGEEVKSYLQEEDDRLMEQGERMNEEKWLQEQGL